MPKRRAASRNRQTERSAPARLKTLSGLFIVSLLLITARLFYWQIIKSSQLKVLASSQYNKVAKVTGQRGRIFSSDGNLLVGNATQYQLYAKPQQLDLPQNQVVDKVLPLLLEDYSGFDQASTAAQRSDLEASLSAQLTTRLEKQDAKFVALASRLKPSTKLAIEELKIKGLEFATLNAREYPEASMAAHITGFVAKNNEGEDFGYFGIEGAVNKELSPRSNQELFSIDALGLELTNSDKDDEKSLDGRDITLTIRRDVQFLIENMLKDGMERYRAQAGEIIVMEPSTGKILALAAAPQYNQGSFYEFDPSLYKNPSLANVFEPGSTFKVLTVAAGIESKAVTPDTQCTECAGPKHIGKYTIRTWNDEYHPNITVAQALKESDNTAMIFIAQRTGTDIFTKFLRSFGIGEELGLDLQEDRSTNFPEKWGPVELATTSFGQGITVNSLQLARAVGAVANKGSMMKPMIIEKVYDPTNQEEHLVEPSIMHQVISPETAQEVSEMMINSAQSPSQKFYSPNHTVAGKTGTAQVVEDGEYVEGKTIASFIGFVPPENPRFLMYVKLTSPQTSQWGAETAAPLWYKTAQKLYLLLNIPPDK